MTDYYSEEKIKPFRLVKYFTFSSLIVIFLGTLILSFLNTYWARRLLLQKNEAYAHVLIANLDHQVFQQFMIPAALRYGKIQLSDEEQQEWMDKVVRSTLHSFEVDMVNIYGIEDIISYSYDKTRIGREKAGGTGYQNALMGRSTSKLVQRGNFLAILLGFPKESELITFAPLHVERALSSLSGPICGVVEIVQDLSEDFKAIFRVQTLVVATSMAVMGILFIILRYVVKRGEEIIENRAQERMELKEQLSRAERLSSIGEMVATISHEIRNPLGIINSSAELLKKKMVKSDSESVIPEIIVEEAGRLNRIITDFLNFARPRTPTFIPCRIDTILEKNITFLETEIGEKDYRIKKHYSENIPEIMADTEMLYQAFLNILINAVQAMPEGGDVIVEIGCKNNTMEIIFEDTGKGVPDDVIEKIWNPFFTTKEKGTGLGLGIVKNIIEQHHGHIHIENKNSGGARVIIELPIE